ncbi:putative Extracellular nuclease [Shewanella benthica]|uniref:Putative Extracellular nuclease n=1 Tax=Shewanella benthica TaxID=43661 RepID=A0A330M379_9GAMM|nr:ExeM/NucH family extracellular endonuclease [Shewanella benthica]SQH77066.1 putative Extracellular nuclease [Shewanella benthica]
MFTKASLLALAIGGVSTFAQAADHLIISEYVEGSSNNKAIEFYNPTNTDIDLNQYQVEYYFNGNTTVGSTIVLTGTLAAGETYVLADNDANAEILAIANQVSNSSFFNGDDAIVLRKSGAVVDSLGQVGVDPGSQWGSGDLSTQDNTLRRDPAQLIGDSIIDDEVTLDTWQGFAKDDFSDLGQFNAEPTDPTDPTDPTEPVTLVCNDPSTAIHAIQGLTDTSPLNGQLVEVEAIVTSNQEAGLKGLFVQMADNEVDGDPLTSEGVFVYTGSATGYLAGDRIRIQAKVKEYNGLTELTDVAAHILCDSAQAMPTAAIVTLPIDETSDLEAFEGMRVSFSHNLTVNEVYNLGRYGELLLGSQRHYIGTQVAAPGSDALAVTAANAKDAIVLDDGLTSQNPDPVRYPAPGLSASNTVRVGDTITGLDAVMHYAFGKYRLLPMDTVNFVAENGRNPAPTLAAGGNLILASFNVLNYFNGDGAGAGFPTPRGADTVAEFTRQRDKIIAAMVAINADVLGLMEIENDGFGSESAIADLVSGLNQAIGETRYAYVSAETAGGIGTDAITVGMIYRLDKVSPDGVAKVLLSANSPLDENNNPLFNDGKNRPMLTQGFRHLDSDEVIVVAVNHFKSKGSDCDSLGDPNMNDGQGNCNLTRTRAAEAVSLWLAAEYGEADVLVMGDLNAYAQENPLTALKNAGYTELFDHLDKENAYSYVYSGESGQLDHALANASLLDKIIDVTEWHINTDEPRLLDYNQEFKSDAQLIDLYNADAYRSSDHDPVVISVLLGEDNIAPVAGFTVSIDGAVVMFNDASADEDGEIVSYSWELGDGTVAESAMVSHEYAQDGDYLVTLTVTDNDGLTHNVSQTITIDTQADKIKPVAVIKHIDLWFIDLFVSMSFDEDGYITKHKWKFNDGSRASGPLVIKFASRASKVKLVVKDNDGLKGKTSLKF